MLMLIFLCLFIRKIRIGYKVTQGNCLSHRWQVVKSAHRHLHFVTHAVAVDDDLRRVFVAQDASQFANHGGSRVSPIIGALPPARRPQAQAVRDYRPWYSDIFFRR